LSGDCCRWQWHWEGRYPEKGNRGPGGRRGLECKREKFGGFHRRCKPKGGACWKRNLLGTIVKNEGGSGRGVLRHKGERKNLRVKKKVAAKVAGLLLWIATQGSRVRRGPEKKEEGTDDDKL